MGSKGDDYEYVFPDVSVENERLAGQHQGIKLGMGRRLCMAPLDLTRPNLRIFDGGTSDGYWLDDLKKELSHPETCELFGGDVTGERFPDNPPEGVKLFVQSSTGPFPDDWIQSFDLVHQRLTLAGLGNQSRHCVDQLMSLVKPGGWVQLVELDDSSHEPNGPAVKTLGALVARLAEGMGADLKYRRGGMEQWVRDNGFIRVGSILAPVCMGAECPDPSMREQTTKAFSFTAEQLIKACKRFPGGLKVITDEEAGSLVERLENELRTRGGYFPVRVVWGKRPVS
ncbi:hypothetical protein FGRMN_3688 [Fusarium graminum]|nr:hypothetical protein FGRMN_3688 [Fusarium graminum]